MTAPAAPTVWVLTDGKAGDEQPLIGIAEALEAEPVLRRVRPRALFAALMPWGPVDPREGPGLAGGPLAPPYPDVCLASGRRAVPYLRALKAVAPATLTVFVKDPRTRRHGADLVVVQAHDHLAGPGILVTATGPHRLSPARLAAARETAPAALTGLPGPRVAVLVGGDSRHHRFTGDDIRRLMDGLAAVVAAGGSPMITTSRRTPAALAEALARFTAETGAALWTGTGDNPLAAYLALADAVVVSADSTNMIGEAAATGRPIHVFHPSGGHAKTADFLAALSKVATVRPFPGPIGGEDYPPVDATPAIARTIRVYLAGRDIARRKPAI